MGGCVNQKDSKYSGSSQNNSDSLSFPLENSDPKLRSKTDPTSSLPGLPNQTINQDEHILKTESQIFISGAEECNDEDCLRGTIVNSQKFQSDFIQAKSRAEAMGDLPLSRKSSVRKYHRKVAGLSIISEKNQSSMQDSRHLVPGELKKSNKSFQTNLHSVKEREGPNIERSDSGFAH